MAKLTDTQLVILSTASRRNDRGVDLPRSVTAEAVRKAVDKLIRTGLLEEVRAHDSLLAWRRDAEAGPMALRITKQGLEAIGVKDVAVGVPTEPSVSPAPDRTEVEASAAEWAGNAHGRVEERTSKAGLSLSSSSLSGLLQIDSLVAAVFVELGCPYLVRALMPGWTEADGYPQPHVEITHCF
jgi:hypothetical protein